MLAITGGGSSAISELLSVPGASNTILEATVPYSSESLQQFLGFQPAQSCSAETARTMAMAAYLRASQLDPGGETLGLGCTAALATNRPRRGADRCFVAVQSRNHTTEISLVFDTNAAARSRFEKIRLEQELTCQTLIIEAMARSCGLIEKFSQPNISQRIAPAQSGWGALLRGEITSTWNPPMQPDVLFPGAFNPIHDGHRQMHRIAERFTHQKVVLEISISNVDKPPLDYIDMQQRIRSVEDLPLIFTNAPTFVDKSRIFPGVTFVVGLDTIIRIADTKYYSGSLEKRDLAISTLVANRHRFLVFGRLIGQRYLTLSDASIPDPLRQICDGIAEVDFRADLSSTGLRSADPQEP